MTDGVPTLTQVENQWQPGKIREAGDEINARNGEFLELVEQMAGHIREAGTTWEGDAYWAAYDRIVGDRDNGARVAREIAELARVLINSGATLTSYRDALLGVVAEAREAGFIVTEQWSVYASVGAADGTVEQLLGCQTALTTTLNEMLGAQADAVNSIRQAAGEVHYEGDELGSGDDPSDDHSIGLARTEASAVAFTNVFGRKPVSLTDWQTAASLNPNSYDPKYQGVGPEVRVARITPVPGQGVVRVAQYIGQEKVIGVPQDPDDILNPYDLGDNRTEDPHFDPEHARVTTYIDYENGLVVVRQNPSVTADGEVRVDTPEADVWQVEDGSVRIRYDARNPFAPGVDTGHTVNGDLTFTPGPNGVAVNGTRTDYPSLEAYQDYPDGNTSTVAVDPAASGRPWGPAANLPFHHDIGSGAESTQPFKTYPWSSGELPPPQDLPWTNLGTVDNPPVVETVVPEYPTKSPTA